MSKALRVAFHCFEEKDHPRLVKALRVETERNNIQNIKYGFGKGQRPKIVVDLANISDSAQTLALTNLASDIQMSTGKAVCLEFMHDKKLVAGIVYGRKPGTSTFFDAKNYVQLREKPVEYTKLQNQ